MALGSIYATTQKAFSGGGSQAFFRSDNGGVNWAELPTVSVSGTRGAEWRYVSTWDGVKVALLGGEFSFGGANYRKILVSASSGDVGTWTETNIAANLNPEIPTSQGYSGVGIRWLDATTIIAAVFGNNKTIWLKSVDSGISYATIEVQAGIQVFDFDFVSTLVGYATARVGAVSRVYKTIDGGDTWVLLAASPSFSSPAPAYSSRVSFRKDLPDFGIIVDNVTGTWHYTTDGGVTWSPSKFVENVTGYVTDIYTNSFVATLGRTYLFAGKTNGLKFNWEEAGAIGDVWGTSTSLVLTGGDVPQRIWFRNATLGIIITSTKIWRTNNGGFDFPSASWSNVFTVPGGFALYELDGPVDATCTVQITSVATTDSNEGQDNGAVTIVANMGGVEYALNNLDNPALNRPFQAGDEFTDLIPGNWQAVVRVTANPLCQDLFSFIIAVIPNLAAGFEKTDCTAVGADDGTISITVTAGTGNYEVVFNLPGGPSSTILNSGLNPQGTSRDSLVPGVYVVTVTDLGILQTIEFSIIITDPQPPAPEAGTIFQVPQIQSLRFVQEAIVDNCSVMQNFDNTLFCKMDFFKYWKKPYYNKVAKCDIFPIQIFSDFAFHSFELFQVNSVINPVKSFEVEKKIQLTGQVSNHNVYITDHDGTKSRVNFQTGIIPLPLETGETFTILNNLDGFNGIYAIESIQDDVVAGSQYIVINVQYTLPDPASNAQASFTTNVVDFDIWEALVNVGDVADGYYYFKASASNVGGGGPDPFVSEPFHLKTSHPGTNLLEFRNFDNGFGVVYQTGITHRMRIESQFSEAVPNGQDENYRNSNFSPVKLSGKASRKYVLRIFDNPGYKLEVISVALRHDVIRVNGIEYFCEEGMNEPQWKPRYPLANTSAILEQSTWFPDYNGDDIGTVEGEQGFIIANGGFLKR